MSQPLRASEFLVTAGIDVGSSAVKVAVLRSSEEPGVVEVLALRTDRSRRRNLARVIEDLIDVLIEKKVFMFTDLPEGAQQKLLERRGLRKEFAYVDDLFGDQTDYGPGEGNNQGGGGYL